MAGTEMARTDDELDEQYSKAVDAMTEGSKWPGMTYEDGVRATLLWVRGEDDTPPMEDEG